MKIITKYAGLAALVIIVASGSLATAPTVATAAQTGHDPDVNGELRPADAWAPANAISSWELKKDREVDARACEPFPQGSAFQNHSRVSPEMRKSLWQLK